MKNVAIITHSLNTGGAERIAGYLSKYLAPFYNVFVMLADTKNTVYEHGGRIVELDPERLEEDLIKKKIEYKIDCSISFLDRYNLANAKTRVADKVILSQRNTLSEYHPEMSTPNSLYALIYKEADTIVACSYGVKEDLVEKMLPEYRNTEVIYNFIDLEKCQRLSEIPIPQEISDWLGSDGYILNVGRLEAAKNQKMLIRQYAKYSKTCKSPYKLIILGSGSLKEELEKEIDKNDIRPYIRILPFTDNPFPFYKGMEFLAVSSQWEGLPNVIIESMVFKKAVVSTDCISGPRELLDDITEYHSPIKEYRIGKRGILVEIPETDETEEASFFAEAMKIMSEDTDLRRCMEMETDLFIGNYDIKSILDRWKSVIEQKTDESHRDFINEDAEIDTAETVIVYGAGKWGRKMMDRVKMGKRDLCCYAVTDEPQEILIDGIEVKKLDELIGYKHDALLIIATIKLDIANEMIKKASELGFKKIVLPIC